MAAGQLAKRIDRFLGADDAALLEHMAEDHDDRQQRGGEQIAGRPRTEHGQRDQLIGDAVQARITQAVPRRTDHRDRHQQRGETEQQLADPGLLRKYPAPEQAQTQQSERKHRQGQLARGTALFGRGQQTWSSGVRHH